MGTKKLKTIKGYVYIENLKSSWKGADSAMFVYRKKTKSETHMIPVLITPLTPK